MNKQFIGSIFLMASLMIIGQPSFAGSKNFKKNKVSNKDVCLCQTGASPSMQIPFFKIGCIMWLATKSCANKKTISVNDEISKFIPKESEGHTLHLGYVGHWGSSNQLINFIEDNVAHVLKEKDMSLKLDNTACNAMDRPELVKAYVDGRKLVSDDKTIEVKGNQTISIGMWNSLTFGDANLNAIITNKNQKSILPSCNKFENEFCIGEFQNMQVGRCISKNGEQKLLFCKEKKFKFRALSKNRKRRDTYKRHVWDLRDCNYSA